MGRATENKNRSRYNVVTVSAVVAGVIFIIMMFYGWNRFVEFRNGQLVQERINQYNHAMLVFCYDRDIKPCNNQGIWNWNADHASDQFSYKSAQQLADEVHLSNF